MLITITSPRLILREYESSDLEDLHAYCSLPEVARYMAWGPNSLDQTETFLTKAIESAHKPERVSFELGIELKESKGLIGGVGMRIKHAETADIGYVLTPSVWNKGIGTEAVYAMLKLAFDGFKLHRVWATVDPENKGSESIMKKNGMRKEAHFRSNSFTKGVWRDTLMYAMLQDDWATVAQPMPVTVSLQPLNEP